MNGNSVGEGSEARRRLQRGSGNGCASWLEARLLQVLVHQRARLAHRAGECQAQTVEHVFLAQFNNVNGDISVFGIDDEFGYIFGQPGHGGKNRWTWSAV